GSAGPAGRQRLRFQRRRYHHSETGMKPLWLVAALLLAACSPPPPAGSRLAALVTDFERTRIAGMKNLSGITWSGSSHTLFAISNRPTAVAEFDREGRLLRSIALQGFEDTEDIAWLGDDRFAVIEE